MSEVTRRIVVGYSMVVTGGLVFALLGGAGEGDTPMDASFREITVERINVVEPDGRLRMVVSNHDRLPGIIVRGEEQPFERSQAGMLFYNDDESETGGLIFGGRRDADGNIVDSGGSLSFDKYEANQVVQLLGVDDSENRFAGLVVTDSVTGSEVYRRLWAGRTDDGATRVALMDGKGRRRLVLEVLEDGMPSVTFLDEDGSVVRRIAPSSSSDD